MHGVAPLARELEAVASGGTCGVGEARQGHGAGQPCHAMHVLQVHECDQLEHSNTVPVPTVPAVSLGSGKLCVARQKQSFWLLGCGSPPNASLEHSIWFVTRTAHAQLSCVPYFTNPLHVHAVPPCSWAQCSHAKPVWLGSAQTSTMLGLTFAVAASANAAIATAAKRFAGTFDIIAMVVVYANHACSASSARYVCVSRRCSAQQNPVH